MLYFCLFTHICLATHITSIGQSNDYDVLAEQSGGKNVVMCCHVGHVVERAVLVQ